MFNQLWCLLILVALVLIFFTLSFFVRVRFFLFSAQIVAISHLVDDRIEL